MNPFIAIDAVEKDLSKICAEDVNETVDNNKESIDTANISPAADVNYDDMIFTVFIPINIKSKNVEEVPVKWLLD